MKLLFLHQNFPGQFKHLAPALAAQGHEVVALTLQKVPATTWQGVRVIPYTVARGTSPTVHPWVADFETKVIRAEAAFDEKGHPLTPALVAELAIQSKETDRKFQETEAQMRETDRKMREVFARFDNLSRRFGDLGNRLGEFVEAMVEPAVVELFRRQGLDVNEVYPRLKLGHGRERIEIDLLVVDGDTAVAVECKSEP